MKINGGTFIMGSPETEPGRSGDAAMETRHQVTITKAFYMSRHQVTQKQYAAVMGSLPAGAGAYGKGDYFPVYNVSWYDAIVFCNKFSVKESLTPAYRIKGETDPAEWGEVPENWDASSPWNSVEIINDAAGYRLPTEAQWEYACRAGTTTAYNTGDTISDKTGWYSANSEIKIHDVGLKPANAFGLYDMHGNVWEWCWDWYGTYPDTAQIDPAGAVSGVNRVKRGGSWYYDSHLLRSANRFSDCPNTASFDAGFRLVRPWTD